MQQAGGQDWQEEEGWFYNDKDDFEEQNGNEGNFDDDEDY